MSKLAKRTIPRIIDAVAEAEDVEPTALDPPLAEVIDPEALETVIEDPTSSTLEVRFTYRGHDVAVNESGRVQVR